MNKLRGILCVLVGHSRCVTFCFGYVYCARCDAEMGDTLTKGPKPGTLVVGVAAHSNCGYCEKTRAQLTWKDTFLLPRDKRPD